MQGFLWKLCWLKNWRMWGFNPKSTNGGRDFLSEEWVLWWCLHSFRHVCLWVNLMCWCDYLRLEMILLPRVILLGYVVTWWMTSSRYGSLVNLGMSSLRLGVILFALVSFYTLVRSTESCYDRSSFWLKFWFYWHFVWFGVATCLGTINTILV